MFITDFYKLVYKLRSLQKEFYKTRDKEILKNSLAVAKEVDVQLKDYLTPVFENESKKNKLFPNINNTDFLI